MQEAFIFTGRYGKMAIILQRKPPVAQIIVHKGHNDVENKLEANGGGTDLKIDELRLGKEKVLFKICFAFSLLVWLLVIISIVGVVYGLGIAFFLMIAHAMMIAYFKGHGVKLSSEQLPKVYERVVLAARKLEMATVPDVYIMQAGGMLNAFATKLFGRNFVIIYSDLLDACDPEGREMDMIIGHELGHLALGHLKWLMFLAPARILPWLGSAYSRACEYSCDRCGAEVVGDLTAASRGLVILAAGGKYAGEVNLNAFVRQVEESSGFWSSIYELNASHPFLTKRVAALVNWRKPGAVQIPRRNPLAYPFAPFLGIASPTGAGAGALVVVAMVGIMAAIAIPQFEAYRAKAQQAAAEQELSSALEDFHTHALDYAAQNNTWPCTEEELNYAEGVDRITAKGWQLELGCQDGYLALIYPVGQKRYYKVVYLESGEIEDGEIGNE